MHLSTAITPSPHPLLQLHTPDSSSSLTLHTHTHTHGLLSLQAREIRRPGGPAAISQTARSSSNRTPTISIQAQTTTTTTTITITITTDTTTTTQTLSTPRSNLPLQRTPLYPTLSRYLSFPSPQPPYNLTRICQKAIDLDGRDPDFAASLRTIGPVTPNPTYSPSSTFSRQPAPTVFPPATNPALLVFSARQRITKAAEQEAEAMGKMDFQGREFLDALTIRQVLAMRDRQGLGEREIERVLRLKGGVVGKLGERGVVGDIG